MDDNAISGVQMSEPVDLTLVLPAYNERASIGRTIDEAVQYFASRRLSYEIIVSADGTDGTRELVREMGLANPSIRAIGQDQRSGKGRGIREAVALARGRIIGFADADNKVPIQEYDEIDPWLREGCGVVTGSRALAQSRIERRQPWYRRIGSKGFYVFMQTVVGLRGVRDTQCGFKFFHRDVAKELFRLQRIDGYMFDVEILFLASRLGVRIKEVPIRWRDDGDSRLQLWSGNVRNALDVIQIPLMHRKVRSRDVFVATAAVE
ncbi:MAG TPA: dolichyl-phosphate beta-glucosyltransferase [Armatimonadota bacterium]